MYNNDHDHDHDNNNNNNNNKGNNTYLRDLLSNFLLSCGKIFKDNLLVLKFNYIKRLHLFLFF